MAFPCFGVIFVSETDQDDASRQLVVSSGVSPLDFRVHGDSFSRFFAKIFRDPIEL